MIKDVRVKFSVCVCKCVYTMRVYYKSMYTYIYVCVCGLACLCRLDPIIPMIEKNIEIFYEFSSLAWSICIKFMSKASKPLCC
jgi:hypothetical protein